MQRSGYSDLFLKQGGKRETFVRIRNLHGLDRQAKQFRFLIGPVVIVVSLIGPVGISVCHLVKQQPRLLQPQLCLPPATERQRPHTEGNPVAPGLTHTKKKKKKKRTEILLAYVNFSGMNQGMQA